MNFRIFFVLLGALCLCACQSKVVKDPAFGPVMPEPRPDPVASNGSLYKVGYTRFLFQDLRPQRVGDLLLVELVEKTDASKKAETSTEKSTSLDLNNPTIFGTTPQFNVGRAWPLASTTDLNLDVNASSEHSFDGSGESTQSNSLEGSITVMVVQVLPNGNLVVRGEKIVTLNRGPEFVRLKGIVRPEDVSADNTVLSTRIANVEIIYGGEGEVADASKLGWIARFFISALMPF